METISAYEARVRFGDLLNRVYYGGVSIEIERYGNPIAKLIPPDSTKSNKKTKKTAKRKTKKRKETVTDKLTKFAGIWSDEDAEKMIRDIRAWRDVPERPIPSLD
ncbi:MAG: type II toxin-antitoxin system Phd/YefM family antitoxin [Candidatus Cloacimonetes bacterium]|nr:type II toxin-antitoxin system Phd/YefM family antitoxin [Candidatus Cloacimonadota bacterium]